MSKRWSVNFWGPGGEAFLAIMVRAESVRPVWRDNGTGNSGWHSLTLALLGFGVSLTYWRRAKQPDVYGDGGVA